MFGMDNYSIPARLVPAILVFLPLGLATAVWLPQDMVVWSIGSGVTVPMVLAFLMAERARRLGRKVQERMVADLGAMPTTILLRHRDPTLDVATTRRYHACLQELVPSATLPSPEEEADAPDAADAQYSSCVKFLLEQTRDPKRHPLVLKDNVIYGFVRNLRGMRSGAIGCAAIGLVACTIRALLQGTDVIYAPAGVCALMCAGLLVGWLLRLNDKWVREAAFDYARTLLASCDRMRVHDG